MKDHEHLPAISKSFCDILESLFTPEFYQAFSPKNYPPYNITRISGGSPQICGEGVYQIDIAVAGFTDSELAVELDSNNTLIISAAKLHRDTKEYVHRGISSRSFQLKFKLSPDVMVLTDDVNLSDGILSVVMKRKDTIPTKVSIKKKSVSRKTTVQHK